MLYLRTSQERRILRCAAAVLLAVSFATLLSAPCPGQQSTAAAILTDRPTPELSGQFSMPPTQFRLADSGRIFFSSGAGTALFQWDPDNVARQRLLQTNDPLESTGMNLPASVSGAILDSIGRLLQVNSAGHAAILVTAAVKGATDPAALLLFDGSSYREMKTPLDAYSQIALNDHDRVAALGSSNLSTNLTPTAGIYIGGPDMTAIEVAVAGKPAPAAIGGTYYILRQLIGFNDAGELAFLADVNGGNAQRAIFLFNGSETRVVAKSGTAAGSLTGFQIDTPAYGAYYALNNNGKVAFRASTVGGNAGIWVGDASGAVTKIAGLGEPAGIQELGNCNLYLWLRGFNDSDQVLYDCLTMPGSRNALFLKSPADSSPRVVFKRGQSLGPAGDFLATQQASLNNAGQVAALSSLTGGPSPLAWFFVPGDGDPTRIAAEGDVTPSGGTFGFAGASTPALLNAAGQVVFSAYILESNAAGLFSWTAGGGVKPVVNSTDSLPDGANPVLRSVPSSISDTEALVQFRKAGGQSTCYATQLAPNTPGLRKIVSEFDQVPGLGTVVGPDNLQMNVKGEVVFTGALLGSNTYPASGILASLPETGVQKVALLGESLPGGDTIASISPPQLNRQSQVAFLAATVVPDQPAQSQGQGVFITPITPTDGGLLAVARSGDVLPGGSTFVLRPNTFGSIVLNDNGQVAFRGIIDGGTGTGTFIGSGSVPPTKVIQTGDRVAEGVTLTGFQPTMKMNASGKIAFVANLTGNGRNAGILVATPNESGYSVQPLVMNGDSAPVPGAAAKFMYFREDAIDLSNTGETAFYASTDNIDGWFTAWNPSTISARVLRLQQLANRISVGPLFPQKGFIALAGSGDLAVYLPKINGSDFQPRIVISAPDGSLRNLAWNGEKAGNTGSEFGKLYPAFTATPSGRFVFGAVLLNGPAQAGLFVDQP